LDFKKGNGLNVLNKKVMEKRRPAHWKAQEVPELEQQRRNSQFGHRYIQGSRYHRRVE
jgi:hypothetical protein